ncbi:hypothetical protein [Sphingomonas bacterium]|uniref:hypothetical protein n=1 Tax=Sphingomonas bacterium TaxID=1895847 RepID=UPI0015758C6E|nr:hypothetical protein [Sphingomonas bacterium]
MTSDTTQGGWPISIAIFVFLFVMSIILSLMGALAGMQTTTFGFALASDAAHTLAMRILGVRLFGVGFAATLLLMVALGRSKAARGALITRWLLGLCTSTAVLRGAGLMMPAAGNGPALVVASVFQLAMEGVAIAILFSDDAATWFEPRPNWLS